MHGKIGAFKIVAWNYSCSEKKTHFFIPNTEHYRSTLWGLMFALWLMRMYLAGFLWTMKINVLVIFSGYSLLNCVISRIHFEGKSLIRKLCYKSIYIYLKLLSGPFYSIREIKKRNKKHKPFLIPFGSELNKEPVWRN